MPGCRSATPPQDDLRDRGNDRPVRHGVADDRGAGDPPVRRQPHVPGGPAEDVHRHRQPHALRRRPEGLVVRMAVRLVGRGRARDRHAAQAHPGAALELGDGRLDVGQRDAADAHEPPGRLAAVLAHPVVVAAEDLVDHVPVFVGKGRHVDAGVEHLAAHAVHVLLAQTGGRVKAAGVEPLVAALHARDRRRVVEPAPGDAEAAHVHQGAAEGDERALLAGGIGDDAGRAGAEALLETAVDLGRLDDVRVTREGNRRHGALLVGPPWLISRASAA
jgi:hypothetical protein